VQEAAQAAEAASPTASAAADKKAFYTPAHFFTVPA